MKTEQLLNGLITGKYLLLSAGNPSRLHDRWYYIEDKKRHELDRDVIRPLQDMNLIQRNLRTIDANEVVTWWFELNPITLIREWIKQSGDQALFIRTLLEETARQERGKE